MINKDGFSDGFDGSCNYEQKSGWRCACNAGHTKPCVLKPYWYNWGKNARRFRQELSKIGWRRGRDF